MLHISKRRQNGNRNQLVGRDISNALKHGSGDDMVRKANLRVSMDEANQKIREGYGEEQRDADSHYNRGEFFDSLYLGARHLSL